MALKWIVATYKTSAKTCAYCHKAILPGQQYRFSKTDNVDMHKSCYEVK